MVRTVILAALLLGGTDCSARLLRRAGRQTVKKTASAKKISRILSKQSTQKGLQAAVERALRQEVSRVSQGVFNEQEALRSVFFLQPAPEAIAARPERKIHAATGFVFQLSYRGKTEIWGATAQHVADLTGEKILATFYYNGKKYIFPGTVVQEGCSYRADAALIRFEPTPEFLTVVRPLALDETPVKPNTVLTSYGYSKTSRQFFALKNRRVLCSGLVCAGTSTVPAAQPRTGTCGSPLINKRGLAAGMHCGTPSVQAQITNYPAFRPVQGQSIWPIWKKQNRVAHFVHAHALRMLVRTWHGENAGWSVRWRGAHITTLKVTEFIETVESHNSLWRHAMYPAAKNEAFLDESRLEDFVNPGKGKILTLTIWGPDGRRYISFDTQTQKVIQEYQVNF